MPHIRRVGDDQGGGVGGRRERGEVAGDQAQRGVCPEVPRVLISEGVKLHAQGVLDGALTDLAEQRRVQGAGADGRVQEAERRGGGEGVEPQTHQRAGEARGRGELAQAVARAAVAGGV
jgi:hypothetical protein